MGGLRKSNLGDGHVGFVIIPVGADGKHEHFLGALNRVIFQIQENLLGWRWLLR